MPDNEGTGTHHDHQSDQHRVAERDVPDTLVWCVHEEGEPAALPVDQHVLVKGESSVAYMTHESLREITSNIDQQP